jgi:hypothetical protein
MANRARELDIVTSCLGSSGTGKRAHAPIEPGVDRYFVLCSFSTWQIAGVTDLELPRSERAIHRRHLGWLQFHCSSQHKLVPMMRK